MRLRTLWLAAVLVATNSATVHPLDTTTDHIAKVVHEDIVHHPTTHADQVAATNTELATADDEAGSLTNSPEDATSTKEVSEENPITEEKSEENSGEQRTSEEKSDENVVENPPVDTNTREDDIDSLRPSAETSESEGHTGDEPEGSNHVESSAEDTDISKNSEDGEISIEDLVVTTKSGPVQGYLWQERDNIVSFIDIPYGSIENHFQAAIPANAWETIHNVKDHNKRCPQLEGTTYVGDNDCLTLSIFKPQNAEGASVLFHIHAEDFDTGSGDPSIYGPEYLVNKGIILVLPNYRLGPLGFLCMQNETAPGNMALKDLSLALSWISTNIEAFGGNPNSIAVSGEGRSGALAGLLALSPMSKNYVSKVIAESGSFLSYWALDRDPTATASELFDKIQENEERVSRIHMRLTEVPIQTILTAAKGLEFRPCLEDENDTAFISETPYNTITTEKFEETSFLLGSAMYAGIHEALFQTEDSIQKLNEDFTLLLPSDLNFNTDALRNQAGERVKTQYFGDEDISLEDVKDLSLCFTDIGYLGPGIRSARLLAAAGATVYFYEFAYVGALNRVLQSVNHPVEGAVRGDIVGYLFTQDGVIPGEEQTEEGKMVESLTKMWTNFVKTGTPSTEDIAWNSLEKEVDDDEEEWLLIDAEPTMKKGLHVERLPLWTEIYDNHYIDGSHGHDLSPSVYTVLIFQLVFWLTFCRNVSHIY